MKSVIHAAQGHVATQLRDSNGVIGAVISNQSLPLKLDSHGCNVLDQSLYEIVKVDLGLFR